MHDTFVDSLRNGDDPRNWGGHPGWDDPEKVMSIVAWRRSALQYATLSVRDDPDVIRAACNHCPMTDYGGVIKQASARLRDDKTFLLSLPWGGWLQHVSARLQDDKDIAIKAASSGRGCDDLRYAYPLMQDDKDVVVAHCRTQPAVLQYASARLRSDADLVLSLSTPPPGYPDEHRREWGFYGLAARGATDDLKGSLNFARRLLAANPVAVKHMSPDVRGDAEFCGEWIQAWKHWHNGKPLPHVGDNLRNDYDFWAKVTDKHCDAYFFGYSARRVENGIYPTLAVRQYF